MKRSEINSAILRSGLFFINNGWGIPPQPKWDVTDFGLGDFSKFGLILVNLAEEVEYCEKLMYAAKGQTTPSHTHKKKEGRYYLPYRRTGSTTLENQSCSWRK